MTLSAETRYRGVAVLALAGAFISTYLLLYSLGYYGMILCGTGSCEVVQTSKYAVFLGLPVPGWGAAWYAGMLVLALIMAAGRPQTSGPGKLIAVFATAGLAFSIYLSALEAFVIHAWCRWCLVSAALTIVIFLLVAPWRSLRRD
ncbi:MAG: vitamin K epoxide reductase family protein [Gemmatimonadota bacterium]